MPENTGGQPDSKTKMRMATWPPLLESITGECTLHHRAVGHFKFSSGYVTKIKDQTTHYATIKGNVNNMNILTPPKYVSIIS